MKKLIFVAAFVVLAGCAYQGESVKNYIEEPQWLIKDPHYGHYQEALRELESAYLSKKITYAEYVEKKNELEEKYLKEVQERNQKVAPSAY